MTTEVWVAIIAAVAPTLAAVAALWQVRKLSKPLDQVNTAVNHRRPGQPTLIETVDAIAAELGHLRIDVQTVRADLQNHLAHHQREHQDGAA